MSPVNKIIHGEPIAAPSESPKAQHLRIFRAERPYIDARSQNVHLASEMPRHASSFERLAGELLAEIAKYLSPTDLVRLMHSSRTLATLAHLPHMKELKVTADAKLANTLLKLWQLLGDDPFYRSRYWHPKFTLSDLSPARRVRPLLVMAALHKTRIRPVSDRPFAQDSIWNAGRDIVPPGDLAQALTGGPGPAALRLVREDGATVHEAASLFDFDGESPSRRRALRAELEQGALVHPGVTTMNKRVADNDWRPLVRADELAGRIGLDTDSHLLLELLYIAPYWRDARAAGLSVDETMAVLGLSSPQARYTLASTWDSRLPRDRAMDAEIEAHGPRMVELREAAKLLS